MDVKDLANNLNAVNETLGLLIDVSTEALPKMQTEVKNITECIKKGFNISLLREQAISSINEALNDSKINQLKNDMTNTLTDLKRLTEKHEAKTNFYTVLFTILFCLTIGILIGGSSMMILQNNRIDRYQKGIMVGDQMANFINKSCENKKAFGLYVGSKVMDCEKTTWKSPMEISN